jgi:CBS domain-containing protein
MLRNPTTLPATATVAGVRSVLSSDHVHLALVVDRDGRLLTTIDRTDLAMSTDDERKAQSLGRLGERVVLDDLHLAAARQRLDADGGRRLAVVDRDGRLVGLLCLTRKRDGYCSERDVEARRAGRAGGAGGGC